MYETSFSRSTVSRACRSIRISYNNKRHIVFNKLIFAILHSDLFCILHSKRAWLPVSGRK